MYKTERDARQAVVSVLQGWVGKKEKDGSHRDIIDRYNRIKPLPRGYRVKYTDAWCAATVSAAFAAAGLQDIGPAECSCPKLVEKHRALGQWQEADSHSPLPGDVILYDWQDTAKGDNRGNPDHIGVVEKVVGNTITVLEGNIHNAVGRRLLAVNGRYIRGYCVPKYAKHVKRQVDLQQYGAALRDVERLAWVPASGKGETVSAAAKTVRWNGRAPDAICNAELFTSAMKPASGCSDHVTQTLGFAFVQGRTPVLSYANNRKAEDWIGSYPMLLRDGKLAFDAVPRGLEGKRARTALGISDTHFAFFFVKEADGCTLQELAEAIRERGFHTAVNLDGGGSTSCVTPFVVYEQGRRVRGKIAMWVKGGKGNKLTR